MNELLRSRGGLFLHGGLLTCAAVIVFAALRLEPTDARCDRHSLPWSPASSLVRYRWETLPNHLWAIDTPYFGFSLADEIDTAWAELLPQHPIAVPSSRLADMGFSEGADDPSWVRNPSKPGAILAIPEYVAQLGCLNLLRRVGYKGGDEVVWERTYQCLERLRQAFMCWSDTGAVLLKGPQQEFDFGTLHYCRNFDQLHERTLDSQVKEVSLGNFKLW